jgi:GT2 family glycosyltransferase
VIIFDVFQYISSRLISKEINVETFFAKASEHVDSGTRKSVTPHVEIIIPTRDRVDLLRPCIDSILRLTTYTNYSILVVDNDSSDAPTLQYLASLGQVGITVISHPGPFNFSRICNFAIDSTSAQYVCLLNNDTLVSDGSWLTNLIDHASLPGVGVVGSTLTYPDGSIQHLGVQVGYRGAAGHVFAQRTFESIYLEPTELLCNEVDAVTFACALMTKKTWTALNGLDETFRVGLNDVDFCLRAKNIGLKVMVCGKAQLTHFESKSRKSMKSPVGASVAAIEVLRFMRRHEPYSREV